MKDPEKVVVVVQVVAPLFLDSLFTYHMNLEWNEAPKIAVVVVELSEAI